MCPANASFYRVSEIVVVFQNKAKLVLLTTLASPVGYVFCCRDLNRIVAYSYMRLISTTTYNYINKVCLVYE